MKNKKIIGILGGMGPSASGYLYNVINSLAVKEYGVRRNDEFPETILYSVPVPDFISSNRNKEKALQMLKQRVKQMNLLPITVIGIACNTAHMLLPELQHVSKARFVSMIEEVAREASRKNFKTIGILATSTTIRSRLYQEAFGKRGIKIVSPSQEDQKDIDTIIQSLIGERVSLEQAKRLSEVADRLRENGTSAIVLCCTELPLLFPKKYQLPVFNSVEILARALLRETMV